MLLFNIFRHFVKIARIQSLCWSVFRLKVRRYESEKNALHLGNFQAASIPEKCRDLQTIFSKSLHLVEMWKKTELTFVFKPLLLNIKF